MTENFYIIPISNIKINGFTISVKNLNFSLYLMKFYLNDHCRIYNTNFFSGILYIFKNSFVVFDTLVSLSFQKYLFWYL